MDEPLPTSRRRKSGHYITSERLQPVETATRVRVRTEGVDHDGPSPRRAVRRFLATTQGLEGGHPGVRSFIASLRDRGAPGPRLNQE